MSINVRNIVFHQLVKRSDSEIAIVLRESELKVNDITTDLIEELNKVYNQKQKSYAIFNENSMFADIFRSHQSNIIDFVQFTSNMARQLRNELAKYSFAESGTIVFCLYNYLAVDYLMVAIVNSNNSILINDNMDIQTTQYLDIGHTDIMACINLTEWKTEPDSVRYLSFIKGRVGRKVSDFFMDFLGASEGMNTRALNKTLVRAVDDYCSEIKLDKQEKQLVRDQVYSYCKGQTDAGEEINLDHLSQEIPIGEASDFQSFVDKNGYELDKEFPVDKSVIKSLKKYSGAGGGLNISFDANLLSERVVWDQTTDTLTIKGTPPNLRDQLQCKGDA